MYSYNDFERLFLRYKLEGIPAGVSIEKFCMSNQVPYNLFSKWYKDTRKKIVEVQVDGVPSVPTSESVPSSSLGAPLVKEDSPSRHAGHRDRSSAKARGFFPCVAWS